MSTKRKIAIGLGVASGALLTAWLLTGDRKKKTKEFFVNTAKLKGGLKKHKIFFDDSEAHYV